MFAMMREVPLDFDCVEDYTFTCGSKFSFVNLFELGNRSNTMGKEMNKISHQLTAAITTICGTKMPIDFYSKGSYAEKMKSLIEPLVKSHSEVDPKRSHPKRCNVTLIDRTIDPLEPVMHKYGYQSIVHDLVEVEGTKFKWLEEKVYEKNPGEWTHEEVIHWLNQFGFFNVQKVLGLELGLKGKKIDTPNGSQFLKLTDE
eukprot:UN30669